MVIDEVYHDCSYVVKATGRIIVVNQIDTPAETVADRAGNWYNVSEIEETAE